jgi:hypothetical protein
MPLSRTGRRASVVLLAIALAVSLTYPLAFGIDRVGRLNTGDGQFSLWNVSWVAHALTTTRRTLFDANIFYSHTHTLAYSESNIFAGLTVGLGVIYYAISRRRRSVHRPDATRRSTTRFQSFRSCAHRPASAS